jgi:protein-S-isoprenylcysteine O-methyltransferase Ste14
MRATRRSALIVAWIGAALFAASLAWFVYCYMVRFGRPAPSGDILDPLIVNLLLFSAFALHHSVLARSGAKQVVRRIVPAELERSLYTWVSSVLFFGVCAGWQPVPGVLYQFDGAWRILFWAGQVLGLLLTLRASSALDVLDLAGVRAVLRSGTVEPAAEHTPLTTRGLYGFVRHPLYFAWALFVFATPTMTGTRAAFAVISTAYLMLAIPFEERSLVATFGREYEAYRRRVKSRMIPGIY